jgi:DNA-binding XRE family transcriptional regulator
MTPLDADNLAGNVRRLAGMHLVPMERLAEAAGLSRAGLMKLTAYDSAKRSHPKAETAITLATLFGVSLNDLYAPPENALLAAVEAFGDAPIRKIHSRGRSE